MSPQSEERASVVREHYEAAVGDVDELVRRVRSLVSDGDGASERKLAAFDQFHLGGLAATAELLRRAEVPRECAIFDAGCGLGGPSRFLARSLGARVAGVDLSPSYVAVARLLTDVAGLAGRVSHDVGDIATPPYEDRSFDAVWTQHVVMNVSDRMALYREFRRLLRPGGRFAFYDPIAADDHRPVRYPTPWAASAATSTLLTRSETENALREAGFDLVELDDVTDLALGWLAEQQRGAESSPLSLALLLGSRMPDLVASYVGNVRDGNVRLVMGAARAR